MREAKALKEYFKIKELFIVIGIVMCIPYIPLTQKIEKNLLLLGFPYKFYSIHINTCIFRKNCASVPEERSAIPLQTEQSSAG